MSFRARRTILQCGELLLAQQRREDDVLNTTLVMTDPQRSVLHTLNANHQRHPIAYSPYGHRAIENGFLSLLGFTGERPDPVTGHYLLGNGYRAFNPTLMRFNSPDKLSPFGRGGLNCYAYCLGDPVNSADPNGHTPLKFLTIKPTLGKLVFAPGNFKNVDEWFDTVYANVPKKMRLGFESPTKNAGASVKRRNSMSAMPSEKHKEFDFNELIGYHGSPQKNTASLLSGINPEKLHNGWYGKGFYSTPTYERTIHYGEKRFGVYAGNQKALKEGRDYTFHRSPDAGRHGDYVELVIRAPAYESVRIREIQGRGEVMSPRSHEAPF